MTARDVLTFKIQPFEGHEDVRCFIPVVNGSLLTELANDFEKARAFEPAGGYGGLIPEFFRYGRLDDYFIPADGTEAHDHRERYVLGCACGEVGCWPLMAMIELKIDAIVLNTFRQPFRADRDYSEFGPFMFDFDQYRNAVNRLTLEFPSD